MKANLPAPVVKPFWPPKLIGLKQFYEDEQLRNVKWLWKHHIPLGSLTLISGEQGHGKSTMLYDIIARLTSGNPMPDGQTNEASKVLILSCEDNPDDSAGPKLVVAGADDANILRWPGTFDMYQLKDLEYTLSMNPEIKMVMIEPIYEQIKGDTNTINNVTKPLEELQKMAARTEVAVIGVHHFGKGKAENSNQKTLGSIGFTSKPRACWGVVLKKDDPTIHIFAAGKRNVKLSDKALQFRIEDAILDINDELIETCKVVWLDETLDTNLDSLLSEGNGVASPQAAQKWLEDFLSQSGEMDSTIIKSEGEAAGFSYDQLFRAKEKLGLKATKHGIGAGSRWSWKLSNAKPESDPLAKVADEGSPF